jgi:colanic acid biosynthesis glycosyl transferase WcaI
MISQTLAATIAAQVADRPDVVMNLGPPLVGPLAGALMAKRFGAKGVTVIYDIYPDVAVSTGKVKNRGLIAAARVVERVAYDASDRIVVLSEGFRRTLVGKGVPAHKLAVIPVWLDPNEVQPLPRETRLRSELGLDPSDFVVLYAGTVGLVSGATIVPEAAALVRNPRVVFLFVGGGEALHDVQERVLARGVRNVLFLPLQPRERLAEVQASADVGLVTLAPGMGRTSVPSKVLGYLAAGRPVLGSVDLGSDTASCVERSGGLVVPPGDAASLARAVDDLSGRDLAAAGAAARRAFLREYTADVAIGSYVTLFQELTFKPRR